MEPKTSVQKWVAFDGLGCAFQTLNLLNQFNPASGRKLHLSPINSAAFALDCYFVTVHVDSFIYLLAPPLVSGEGELSTFEIFVAKP
ncbi:unnamed protein product [Dibothriocephalus latus]|uniref:Uncharacterized protein n=1 Tax=Dibothriocephalus latus TaxID=60516 RepID=A0A3P7LFP1_DIBLA|nr:unnamed protein product [Dibothriocephalus latus]